MSNFRINALTEDDILIGLKRALEDKEKGLGEYDVTVTDEALHHFANASSGDMRSAYNALELAVLSTLQLTTKPRKLHLKSLKNASEKKFRSR